MSAIDQLFSTLRRQKRKALMPFITAGDPDLAFTAAVLKEAFENYLGWETYVHKGCGH